MSEMPNSEPIEILLVEDNAGDARLAEEALKESKVRNKLHHVRDGVEAIQFLRRQQEYAHVPPPDLILLDLNLPKLDGRAVLREIKADPALRTVPVVVMTTSQAASDVSFAYEHQANCYVVKSPDLGEFLRAICAIEEFWFGIARLAGS